MANMLRTILKAVKWNVHNPPFPERKWQHTPNYAAYYLAGIILLAPIGLMVSIIGLFLKNGGIIGGGFLMSAFGIIIGTPILHALIKRYKSAVE